MQTNIESLARDIIELLPSAPIFAHPGLNNIDGVDREPSPVTLGPTGETISFGMVAYNPDKSKLHMRVEYTVTIHAKVVDLGAEDPE